MKRTLPSLLAVVIAGPWLSAQTPVKPASPPAAASTASVSDRVAIDRAIATVFPSLVRITVVFLDQQSGREVKGQLSGSGTIISADGFVVTNHHVAGRPKRIVCTLSDFQEVPADLVGTDPMSDIAVIKLHPEKPQKFPFVRFGDSDKVQRGQVVLAMGSPLALSQSVTQGIVSNKQMIMPQTLGGGADLLDGEDVGSIVRWIGHDAAIYPGNSGGPLVNLAGEIVGVNEISYGLGGAIPSSLAKAVVDALIRDGRVKRSWFGLELQPRINKTGHPGVLVSWVADKSPADAAGFKPGDLLFKVNDLQRDVKYAEEMPPLNRVLFDLPIGQPARFVVVRDGKDVTLTATPIERPAAESMPAAVSSWGLAVANITPLEARELSRESTDGVRIVSLRPNGPADQAKPALRSNDILVEVDGKSVRNVAELQDRTRDALGTNSHVKVLAGFDRDRDRYLTVVDIGAVVTDDPPKEARKAWVPVSVQVLTPPLAEKLGLKGRTGVRVTRLLDSATPLTVGDIILAIDGDAVRASAPNEEDLFASAIRRLRVGAAVTLTVFRAGAETKVPVTLGQTPSQPREMKPYQDELFEFRARNIAESDRLDLRSSDPAGVLVESVTSRGWASLARLNGGDVILTIDGRAVQNVDDLKARMEDIQARKPTSVVFEVRRGIRTMFIEIQPAWK